MLPARARLRTRAEFTLVVRTGRRAARGALVGHLTVPEPSAAGAAPARAGLIVGRTVGGAVVRNRVRRRLRHLLAPLLPTLPAGSALVVRALPAAATRVSADLSTDVQALLARLGPERTSPAPAEPYR